ncbi:MAG: ATPase, T2SS/T4P/T4SS family, partial [Opitutales bacterium]
MPVPESSSRPAPIPPPGTPARLQHHPFWIGLRLVALKRITPEQLASAKLEFQRRPAEGFAAALERLSLTSQKIIAQLTAEHHGLPVTDIPPGAVPAALATRLGAIRARNHTAVPLRDEEGCLTIAVSDPARYTQEEAGQDFPGRRLRFVVAPRNDILSAIDAAHTPPLPATNPQELLTEILTDAVAKRASDVHFEPKPHDLHVRYRIDNSMLHRDALGAAMKPAIIQAIKSLARMDIAQTRLPLDGQARLSLGASTYNLRISTLPTVRGEK